MRARGLSVLVAAVFAVTMNAHAAPPVVDAVAVQTNGSSIVLSGSTTLVYTRLSGAPFVAKVRCLVVRKGALDIVIPPLPTVTASVKNVLGRATANGKTYYFVIASTGPKQPQTAQVVLFTGVATKAANPALYCGGTSAPFIQSAGFAIYR